MKLAKVAKIVAAYAEALQGTGDSNSGNELERLARALKKQGKLDVSFLREALAEKDAQK